MSEKSYDGTATRPVRKSGNSLVVSIPPSILRAAGLRLDDEVVVAAAQDGSGIELRRAGGEHDDRDEREIEA